MLKLKPTFFLYNSQISEQMRKSITNKFIEQIAQCVLADITESSEQAEKRERSDKQNLNGG